MKFTKLYFLTACILLSACSKDNSGGTSPATPAPETKSEDTTTPTAKKSDCGSSVDGTEFMNGIVGGKILGPGNQISSRIVLLLFKVNGKSATCTGSLLPGNVVLTAAHCVPENHFMGDIGIRFKVNQTCNSEGTNYDLPSREVRIHPSYQGAKIRFNYDLALISFLGEVPADYNTFEVPDSTDPVGLKNSLIFAGYGTTSALATDSGILRVTGLANDRLRNTTLAPDFMFLDQHDTGICNGDSGGPMMITQNGKLKIVGVNSAGANPNKPAEEGCSGSAAIVKVSNHSGWIQKMHSEIRD